MKRKALKTWENMLLNSHYGFPKAETFPFYDVDIACKMSQMACDLVRELEKKTK
jgi:hypothetical protein